MNINVHNFFPTFPTIDHSFGIKTIDIGLKKGSFAIRIPLGIYIPRVMNTLNITTTTTTFNKYTLGGKIFKRSARAAIYPNNGKREDFGHSANCKNQKQKTLNRQDAKCAKNKDLFTWRSRRLGGESVVYT